MTRPLIGITVDNIATERYASNVDYSEWIARAGGLPLLLTQEVELAAEYVERCDGIMLTGGPDIRLEGFGIARHPLSQCVEPRRQEFEMALLDALKARPQRPVLGVCLGMQLMSIHAGGRMIQHLPDVLSSEVEQHQHNERHEIVVEIADSVLMRAAGPQLEEGAYAQERAKGLTPPRSESHSGEIDPTIVSSHHQAVENPGSLRIVARSPSGVIEAVDDPARFFYLGVQWHPERGDGYFNRDLFRRFVDACRA